MYIIRHMRTVKFKSYWFSWNFVLKVIRCIFLSTVLWKIRKSNMVKHTRTIHRLLLTNCLSVFDHFVVLALRDDNSVWTLHTFYTFSHNFFLSKEFFLIKVYIFQKHKILSSEWCNVYFLSSCRKGKKCLKKWRP